MASAVAALVVKAVSAVYAYVTANALLVAVAALSIDAALRKPKNPNFGSDSDMRRESVIRSAIAPRNICYGEILVGGVLTYTNVTGDENADMWVVVSHAGHAAEDITDLYLYDDYIGASNIAWGTGVTGGDFHIGGTSYLKPIKRLGASDQSAVSDLVSAFTEFTNDHQGRGCSFTATKLTLDLESEDAFAAGTPSAIKALGQWKNDIYDPRLDSSPGNDPTNASYKAYTTNPILIAANYLTDAQVGMALSLARIDWLSIATGADYCDVLVPTATAGAFEKRFTANGMLTTADQHKDNLTDILTSCNGRFGYRAGKVFLAPGRLGSGFNLIRNPTFDANWTLGVNGGVQAITTVVGQTYTAKVNVKASTSATDTYQIAVSANANGSIPYAAANGTIIDATLYLTWIATTTASYLCLNSTAASAASIARSGGLIVTDSASNTAKFDHVECYLVAKTNIDESWLRGDIALQTATPKNQRFNTARAFYISKADKYKKIEALPVTNTAFVARDDDQELYESFNLPFTDHEDEAQRILHKRIQQTDNQKIIRLPCNYKALRLAVHDHVTLTIAELGFTKKIFRVINWRLGQNSDGIDLVLMEDSAAGYEDPDKEDYSARSAAGVVAVGAPEVPVPTSVSLTAKEGGNLVEWVSPRLSTYFDLVDVYAHPTNSFGSATLLASVRGTSYFHKLDAGEERFYFVQARKGTAVSASVATNPASVAAANALAAAALTANWSGIVDDNSFRPANSATVGAVAGTNLTNAAGTVLDDDDVLNSVVKSEITELQGTDGDVLELVSGIAIQLQTVGSVAKYAFDADQTLNGFIQGLNASIANTQALLGDVTAGTTGVYVQASAPVAGVSGVPDPIATASRWYDSDDNNSPYTWSGSAWVSLLDPRIGNNAASIVDIGVAQTATDVVVTGHTTDIATNATATSTLDTTVTNLNGTVSTISGKVTTLENTLDDLAVGDDAVGVITANSAAINTLESDLTAAESAITSSSTNITNLTNTIISIQQLESTGGEVLEFVDGTEIDLQLLGDVAGASSAATAALDSRVVATENTIVIQSSDIVSLRSDLLTASNAGATNAGATEALTTRVSSAEGTITSEAAKVVALQSTVNNGTTGVTATATALGAVTSRVTDAEGDITSTASSLSTLSTTVGGHTTSINTVTTSVDGIGARYGVEIDANGNLTGFELLSDGTRSAFRIRADQFLIVDPAAPAGAAQAAWLSVVAGVTTLQNCVINGSLLVGTIDADLITAGTIAADRLSIDGAHLSVVGGELVVTSAPGSTLVAAGESTNDGTASATINRTTGSVTTIDVNFTLSGEYVGSTNSPFPTTLTLKRGATTIKTFVGITGVFTPYDAGDSAPAEAVASFGATFYDSDSGTGDTTYNLTAINTVFVETFQLIVRSTQA